MKREFLLLLAFLKDQLSLFILFIFNTAVIILFFNLSFNSTEGLYPACLSAVIFSPYLLVRYFSYRKIMLLCEIGEVNVPDEIYTNKEYIKKINSTLIKIHRLYNKRLNEENQKNLEFKRFISQFIHAMKTPVTVIGLAVQKSRDTDEGQNSEGCMNTIQDISEENQRLLDMLNNLLDYLRINEFNKDYTPVSADLYQELTKVINGRKRSFIYSNVRPDVLTGPTGRAEVLTDLKWNAVMLDQIISNAIKYSRAEGKMKKIDFSIEVQADRTVLHIRDYGLGIPPQDIPRLTEPFFTGENGRKMKNATGIGLYVVRLISESLGHKVVIESQAGTGTCVSVVYYKLHL